MSSRKKQIADFLLGALVVRGLSQRNVSKALNIPYRSCQNYFSGSAAIPVEPYLKICRLLRVRPECPMIDWPRLSIEVEVLSQAKGFVEVRANGKVRLPRRLIEIATANNGPLSRVSAPEWLLILAGLVPGGNLGGAGTQPYVWQRWAGVEFYCPVPDSTGKAAGQ